MEPLGDAKTNVYVLNDFREIAYALCIAHNFTEGSHGLTDVAASPSSALDLGTITRLRTTEVELRRSGILVSLDAQKGELFTFFRKTELQQDGKSIFPRLMSILRSNGCKISYRSTAKAPDLLKPENHRLYEFLMIAVLQSLRRLMVQSGRVLPLGLRTFVMIEDASKVQEAQTLNDSADKDTTASDVDLQLLDSGKLLLTFRHNPVLQSKRKLSALDTDIMTDLKREPPDDSRLTMLAPLGHIARISRSPAREDNIINPFDLGELSEAPSRLSTDRQQELWRSRVLSVLANYEISEDLNKTSWVEIQIPVRIKEPSVGFGDGSASYSTNAVKWLSVTWPGSLCFLTATLMQPEQQPTIDQIITEDPLSFAGDWLNSATKRAKILEERRVTAATADFSANTQADEHELAVLHLADSPTAVHRHHLSDIQFGNNIYPTPPGGALSQVTPGMSSLDGTIATPADPNRQLQEIAQDLVETDMPDASSSRQEQSMEAADVYNDDLFEELPGDRYGGTEIADEPNWDFFDAPDLDMRETEAPGLAEDLNEADNRAAATERKESPIQLDTQEIPITAHHGIQSLQHATDVIIGQANSKGESLDLKGQLPAHSGESNTYVDRERHIEADQVPDEIPLDAAQLQRSDTKRRDGLLESTNTPALPSSKNSKYSTNGRFWFSELGGNDNQFPRPMTGTIPRVGPFTMEEEPALNSHSAKDLSLTPSSSAGSDIDSGGIFEGAQSPSDAKALNVPQWTEFRAGVQRALSPSVDSDIEHLEEQISQVLEFLQKSPNELSVVQPRSFRTLQFPDFTDNDAFVLISRLLVDQVTQSALRFELVNSSSHTSARASALVLDQELSRAFGSVNLASLRSLLNLENVNSDQNELNLAQLEQAHVRVVQDGKTLSALPSILPFWETLGLQPVSGRKAVTAFCIHPLGEPISRSCSTFMNQIGEMYEACELGHHIRGKLAEGTNDGLIAWSDSDTSCPNLLQTCERTGIALSNMPLSNTSILIYMIDATFSCSSILRYCEGFVALFNSYVKTCGKGKPSNVVLQVVPRNFVVPLETLATPGQREYLGLAVEVYNRCPPSKLPDKRAYCASAVTLAPSAKSEIEFCLGAVNPSPFAKRDQCLDVAYSQSEDKRWITAAWTDPYGSIALVSSFCLYEGDVGRVRPISDVIREIWDVSLDIMSKARKTWSLNIAREGTFDPTEINQWEALANPHREIRKGEAYAELTLISVRATSDSGLSMSEMAPTSRTTGASNTVQPSLATYGTPVSTPQTSTSPDQLATTTQTPGETSVTAPTPPENSIDLIDEPNTCLIDPEAEIWHALLPYGLNQADSCMKSQPALASGYLLRLTKDQPAMKTILEVNLLHTPASIDSSYKTLLKEVLQRYGDLMTLAKSRMLNLDNTELLPWHIWTAIEGQRVLQAAL